MQLLLSLMFRGSGIESRCKGAAGSRDVLRDSNGATGAATSPPPPPAILSPCRSLCLSLCLSVSLFTDTRIPATSSSPSFSVYLYI